jgi:acetyltransferase-like isoleucine patch superfamily enzyme
MKNIIILGTGGLAAELTFYIKDNNSNVGDDEKINILGYIDYDYNIEKYWKKYNFEAPVLCDIDSYDPKENEEVLIGIADVNFRNKMIDILLKKNAKIGSFIHHTVIISKFHNLGVGNIVFPYCAIEPHNIVGDFNILTSYSFISHDCIVGNGNFFSKAGIAGHVKIGDNNYFGIGSVIIPHTEIGNNNLIQAGMTVDRSVKDDTTVFYRFKEKVMAIPKK